MSIPSKYQPRLLEEKEKEGWLSWSLEYFTDPNVLQVPNIDLTIQLDVTNAYEIYQINHQQGATFFSFLIWHLMQTMKNHFCFNLRLVENQWYILDNPSVFTPVAIGGKNRFTKMFLENINQLSYPEFVIQYRRKLDQLRVDKVEYTGEESYSLSCFIGNLPNLQFTGLTLHWRVLDIIGQPYFYFGKRYWQNDQLFIPLTVKLHHACNDPFVFDLLIQDFCKRFVTGV